MPCNVICSECGGRGYREFFDASMAIPGGKPIRKEYTDCDGRGYTVEKTFEEKRNGREVDGQSPS